MKKFLLVSLFVLLLPVFVYPQMIVADAMVQSLLTASHIEQAIHYAQVVVDNALQIKHLYDMGQKMVEQVRLTAQNIQNNLSVDSWDDFMNWYNRQLYMETQTVEMFKNMKVNVGGKSYHISDLQGVGEGWKSQWNKEFSEDQRREMWYKLGLTPSNYAYRQVYNQKMFEIADMLYVAPDIINNEIIEDNIANNEINNALAKDSSLPEDERLGDKELQIYQLKLSMQMNKNLNDIKMQNAEMMRMQAIQLKLDNTPYDAPPLSEWPEDGFEEL